VQERYDWDRVADQYLALFAALAARSPHTAFPARPAA